MRRAASTSLMAAALLGLLAGCGQKGPLYLPEKKPAPVSAPATTPPPGPPPPATPAPAKKSDTDKDSDSQPPQ
jgi:predicted small lipoprotein YifL